MINWHEEIMVFSILQPSNFQATFILLQHLLLSAIYHFSPFILLCRLILSSSQYPANLIQINDIAGFQCDVFLVLGLGLLLLLAGEFEGINHFRIVIRLLHQSVILGLLLSLGSLIVLHEILMVLTRGVDMHKLGLLLVVNLQALTTMPLHDHGRDLPGTTANLVLEILQILAPLLNSEDAETAPGGALLLGFLN